MNFKVYISTIIILVVIFFYNSKSYQEKSMLDINKTTNDSKLIDSSFVSTKNAEDYVKDSIITPNDTTQKKDSSNSINSIINYSSEDSKLIDSSFSSTKNVANYVKDSIITPNDTTQKKDSSNSINSIINYSSEDSIIFDLRKKKMYLFGKSKTDYQKISLNAENIFIDMDSKNVYATGKKDSTGKLTGIPVFKQEDKEYISNKIKYNFDTKEGFIQNVKTEEGEGFIYGDRVKKDSSNIIIVKHGKFTTCDSEHPHFYIYSKKLKMIPKKSIITSSATLYLNNRQTILKLPFGIFPNSNKRKSGILIPTYGESTTNGIFINGLGAYLLFGKHADFSTRVDYYFKTGNYTTRNTLNYIKKYKFSGGVNFSLNRVSTSFKELPDYTESKQFSFNWTHRQDPKANPFTTFSANVNFSTSSFYRNSFSATDQDYLRSNVSSSISLSHKVPNKPININISLRQSSNSANKTQNLTLPQFNINVNRINPFKRKNVKGGLKWYEKINMSYSLDGKNEINTFDSLLFEKETFKLKRAGLKHSIPISTSFKVFNYFSLSPSVSYNEVWYPNYVEKKLEKKTNKVFTDTINRFKTARWYNGSISLSTRIYGTLLFKKGSVKGIRHIITPSISFSYTPQFGTQKLGYYKEHFTDTTYKNKTVYSIFQNGVYGGPPKDESRSIGISVLNNLELKVKNKNAKKQDEQHRKIKILEQLSLSTSYDMVRDSLNWSNISLNARTTLFKFLTINYNSTYSLYDIDKSGKTIDKFYYKTKGILARYISSNLSTGVSYSISADKFKQKKTKEDKAVEQNEDRVSHTYGIQKVDFSIPWSFSFNYNFNLNDIKKIDENVTTINQTFSFNGNVSITPKWKVSYNSGYNFDEKSFTYTSFSISRDLHCWVMSLSLVPFGSRQSYSFRINVKSATLRDLKLDRNNFWYDNR